MNCLSKARMTTEVQAAETDSGEEKPSGLLDLAKAWVSLRANGKVPDDVQL